MKQENQEQEQQVEELNLNKGVILWSLQGEFQ